MLFDQNRRWCQQCDLVTVLDRFERRPHGDFCFSKSDITTQQTIHRPRRLHVVFDRGNCGQLIRGLAVGKRLLELVLPFRVRLISDTRTQCSRRLQFQHLGGQVGGSDLSGMFLFDPRLSADLCQLGARFGTADILLHKVDFRGRNKNPGPAMKFDLQVFRTLAVFVQHLQPAKTTDPMRKMHDQIALA